jgi:hypothetical protein
MKTVLQKSVIYFLAVMLIMATGGFSVYHHFCRCEGESTGSVFFEADCDHSCATGPVAECCTTPAKGHSCCESPIPGPAKSGHDHDDCCDSSSSFFKIQDNFRVSVEKISLKFIAGMIKILAGIDLVSRPTAQARVQPMLRDASPPIYGTDLLHHIHQLKLDQPKV